MTANTTMSTKQPSPVIGDGEWIVPSVSHVEPARLSCAFCGRPIARKHWRAAPAGEPLIFCEPGHAELYLSYWLPLHGGGRDAVSLKEAKIPPSSE